MIGEGRGDEGAHMNQIPTRNVTIEVLYSLLHCAAGYNHLDVVEYLLEQGADVNSKDKGGLIPLHNASSFGVSLNRVSIGTANTISTSQPAVCTNKLGTHLVNTTYLCPALNTCMYMCAACGRGCHADQAQQSGELDGSLAIHAPSRGSSEGPHPSLFPPHPAWSKRQHAEPRGGDPPRLGHCRLPLPGRPTLCRQPSCHALPLPPPPRLMMSRPSYQTPLPLCHLRPTCRARS